jgi:hypothetical protein
MVASIALLTNAVGDVTSVLTILEPAPTTTTTTTQTTQVIGGAVVTVAGAAVAAVQTAANVLVTNIVQTTLIDSTPVVVTSQLSVPILPAITSGAATLAIGSNTYTVSINANGNTVVNGKTAPGATNVANGATATTGQSVLETVINGQTILETVIGGQTMQEVVVDGKTVGETVIGGKTMAVWATVENGNTIIESSVILGTPSTIYGAAPTTKTVGGLTSTTTNGAHGSKPTGLGVAAGIGIGVGCTVLLVLLGALLLYCLRRARKRRQQEQEDQEMSAIVGEAGDEDAASSIAPSDNVSEKFEIDGRERRPPVELPGDYWPQEIDGREARSRTPSSLYARDVKIVPDHEHYAQQHAEQEARQRAEDEARQHAEDEARAVSRESAQHVSPDSLSGIVSPIARSNSERETQWPLVSPAEDVSPASDTP